MKRGFVGSIVMTLALILTSCSGNDGTPAGPGGAGGGGTELLSANKNLWLITASTLNDYCASCDSYVIVWQNNGWALVTQFSDWESTCYAQSCGTKQSPFVLKEITVTPHFNLSSYSTAKLRWTEAFRDYSRVEVYVSPDGGTTWTMVSTTTRTNTGTVQAAKTVEITQYLGSAKFDVRVRFLLIAGTNLSPRRVTGADKYECRAEIKDVVLTGYK